MGQTGSKTAATSQASKSVVSSTGPKTIKKIGKGSENKAELKKMGASVQPKGTRATVKALVKKEMAKKKKQAEAKKEEKKKVEKKAKELVKKVMAKSPMKKEAVKDKVA